MIARIDADVGQSTRLAGVIGWPLEHTLSPAMHNAAYQELGLDWLYMSLPAKDEQEFTELLGAIRLLPFVGFNVTMPYKQAMLAQSDEVTGLALLAGAVNTVDCSGGRLSGSNTDGPGLLEALERDMGFRPAGRDVALLGAGGAAGGALVALASAKARSVTVINRDTSRAAALVSRIAQRFPAVDIAASPFGKEARKAVHDADLVLNATSLGMKPDDPSPVPVSWLRSSQVVADMVYRAEPTPLVLAAREAGAGACDGLGMLVCQGAIAIDTWLGGDEARAPRDVMRAAAELEIGRRSTG